MGTPSGAKSKQKTLEGYSKINFSSLPFRSSSRAPSGPLLGPLWGPKWAPKRSRNHTKNHIEICTLKRCPNWPPEALQRPPSWPPNRPQIGLRPLPGPLGTPSDPHPSLPGPSGPPSGPPRPPPGSLRELPGTPSEPLWTLLGGAHGSLPGDPSGDQANWVGAGGIREAIRIRPGCC